MEDGAADSNEELPFQPTPLPRHIAIVMDGNGRWARARGKPRTFGHRAGADAVRRTVDACRRWDIGYLTLYAFSTENWERPKTEVTALMTLLGRYLKAEEKNLHKNNVALRAIGDLERLPAKLRKQLAQTVNNLSGNDALTLTIALSYGGRDEIVRAAGKIAAEVKSGLLRPEDVNEETFEARLDTAGLPDPELLIRTAGEMRISNFLLWQASYAEYYTTEICWPDFGKEALGEAIAAYQRRTRKFGKVAKE